MSGAVLIVDDRRDVLELSRILLAAEGYETEGCTYAEATPERLRRNLSQVVLLDLVPGDEAPWALLRRLRADEATREIGVVVTSDAPALVERALRDDKLGVSAGLVMPFDIEALYAAIAAAVKHEARAVVEGAPGPMPVLQRAADVLRRDRRRIFLRWVQRLSTLAAFQGHPDLSLADLQGQGAELLDGVVEAIALQATSQAVMAATAGLDVEAARRHARLRRSQGFSAADMAREVIALRREVWRAVRGNLASGDDAPPLEDVWTLQGRLNLAIDELLCAILETMDEGAGP